MVIKTKFVNELDGAVESIGMYGSNEIEFLVVDKDYLIDEYPTHCKEELGADCVKEAVNSFLVVLPKEISDKNIEKILKKIHAFEKQVKAPRTEISRVKSYVYDEEYHEDTGRYSEKEVMKVFKNILYVVHGKKWSLNSVAHAMYSTHLRKYIREVVKARAASDDDKHIKSAEWLIEMAKTHGVGGIFKNIQHPSYDIGMISLMCHLKDKQGCLLPKWDVSDIPEEPTLHQFGYDYNKFYAAHDKWYEEYGHIEDDYYDLYGDMDDRLPNKHGYGKIEKLYQKQFVKVKKVVKK